jgi:ADP-ribose pyrophosphatase
VLFRSVRYRPESGENRQRVGGKGGMMKLISSKLRFKCPIFTVSEDEAAEPGGFHVKRAIVHHAGSAVMLAVDEKGRILLVRQYRLPVQSSIWELPAGRLDPGETALAAAKRELAEETGYRARKWTRLVSFYASPGYVAEKMTIYIATGLTAGQATPMEDERIDCHWFTTTEINARIQQGRIIDGKTMIGFLAWRKYFAHRKDAQPQKKS